MGNVTPRHEKTSALLELILAELPEGEVAIGALMEKLRRRSFGGLLILLAALGLLPGIAIASGIVMIVIGVQMLAGFRNPYLPRAVRERNIDVNLVRAVGRKCITVVAWIERYARPRWDVIASPPVPNLVGLVVIGLGLVIMLPLPFSNFPPAIALLVLSVALLERDGLMMALGIVVASVALYIGAFIAYVAVESLQMFFDR